MEVHKHPHHVMHKKKWSEYLLEFFMLFLAVFLGFIAENIREHIVEKERSKQYIGSFCEDLKNDTARSNFIVQYDEEKVNGLITMHDCYRKVLANLETTDCLGQLIKYSRSNRNFSLSQRTTQQLANAGGYRLLPKEDADSILAYENVYQNYLDFQSTLFQSSQDNVRNTLNRFGNFEAIAPAQLVTTMFSRDTIVSKLNGELFFVKDKNLVNQWFNELAMYVRAINAQRTIVMQIGKRATGLLQFFKSKYQLNE